MFTKTGREWFPIRPNLKRTKQSVNKRSSLYQEIARYARTARVVLTANAMENLRLRVT